MKKYPCNILQDSNWRPHDFELPSLTTRPVIPPIHCVRFFYFAVFSTITIWLATYSSIKFLHRLWDRLTVVFVFQFMLVCFLLLQWANPAFYSFISIFSNTNYNFYNKKVWKMSIQYTVPGFELTTVGTQVSSHNH